MTHSRRSALLVLTLTLPALAAAAGTPGAAHAPGVRAAADTVLVAARELRRGAVLGTGDIDTLVVEAQVGRGASSAPVASAAPGWVVRRLVRQGEPLRPPAVAPPALVTAGAQVTLVWRAGELQVTRQGTAVGPGHMGDQVVVRVDATRRFTGRITGPGTVLVNGNP